MVWKQLKAVGSQLGVLCCQEQNHLRLPHRTLDMTSEWMEAQGAMPASYLLPKIGLSTSSLLILSYQTPALALVPPLRTHKPEISASTTSAAELPS